MNPVGFHSSSLSRTLQTPDPPNNAAARVLNALRTGRIADAIKWLGELPEDAPLEQVWKKYLEARILLEQCDFPGARGMARQAASAALRLGFSDPQEPTLVRLAAAALELQGTALRRQDLPVEACRIHRTALELRREHGTPAEQCECAMSLGSCAQWSGDVAAAERWYRLASKLQPADANHARQKSCALIRLSALLTQLSRHEEAVNAAENAQNTLVENLPGDIATVCASLHLAHALIGHAEMLLARTSERARPLLDEVLQMLLSTRENLHGFGPVGKEELNWCDEQLDFVDRLRQSLDPQG